MTCEKEYNLTLLMHLIFGNQYFEPIQKITSFHLQNEFLETKKNRFQRKPFQFNKKKTIFYDLTMEKKKLDQLVLLVKFS